MTRVLIIEDEIIIARYIQQLILENFRWEVAIAVDEAEAALEMKEFHPQLVLCDINLQGKIDGIDLVAGFQESFQFETIFITSYKTKGILEKAAQARPVNYIIKPLEETQLLATLMMTDSRLSSDRHSQRGDSPVKEQLPVKDLLTRSEIKVLQLIAGNLSTREIAGALYISPLTVKNHRHNIARKLDLAPGNNSILKWAIQHRGEL